MSRPMTFKEFSDIVNHVKKNNAPIVNRQPNIPSVKYIDPHFDMRTDSVFAIKFRGFGNEMFLHTQNECRDLPESLYERCMKYLKGEE